MLKGTWLLGTAAVVALAVGACQDPTQIVVRVTTDLDCSHLKAGVTIAVSSLATLETKPTTAESLACDASGKVGTLVIIPSGGTGDEVGIRVVAGLDGKSPDDCVSSGYTGGCIVARRALRFVPHSALDVPIQLEASCKDVPCDPQSTCSHGSCTPLDPTRDASAPSPGKWRALRAQSLVNGRGEQGSLWTGTEAWFWGGSILNSGFDDGGLRFDPANSASPWSAMVGSKLPARPGSGLVWTGTAACFWGGEPLLDTGACFDGKSWTPIASPTKFFPFAPRDTSVNLWADTVKRMIVWGGFVSQQSAVTDDGALYDPVSDTWTPMAKGPLAARGRAAAVWVNGRAVIYGGYCGGTCDDGAVYDPSTNTWSPRITPTAPGRIPNVAVSDGKRAIFWGGEDFAAGPQHNDMVVIDPIGLTADVRTGSNAPSARIKSHGWFSGGKLWVWGGSTFLSSSSKVLGDGASYDFATDAWTPMATAGAPTARQTHRIVWTGSQAILFGGYDTTGAELGDGAIFVP